MTQKLERRDALRRIALIIPSVVAPSLLLACSKKPSSCTDETGLSPEDLRVRNEAAKYVDRTMEAAKRCSGCLQYIEAAPDKCGGCKVIKGPVHPDGYCVLYVAKAPT